MTRLVRLDRSGRVVIPLELRLKTGLREGDYLEILTEDDKVILRKVKITRPEEGERED